jgi:hypothetical protein
LWLRQCSELVEQRRAELMDPGERQLHLRLRARDLSGAKSRRLLRDVTQERRLTDPRLATNDHHAALTIARMREQPVERVSLAGPV